ncbi:MAG TPA: TonB-dependent receptor, partial [Bacteroidales bacterium]|nr:TonB-dependent receptor [Bacteroidales bacterium]
FSLKNNQEELSYIDAIPILQTSGTTQELTQANTLYSRYGTTLKKWKIDAGLSLNYNLNDIDYLRYNGQSVDTSFVFNKYYINPSPSATIIYSADSLNDFKISYSHSVQTPYYTQVCDFVNKQNPYSWNVGNPALEPVNYHNFFIGYTLNKNIWNVNIDVFYSLTRNDISYLTLPVTETIWISMPENIGKNTSTGIDVSAYASIKSKIDLNFSSRIYHTNIKADNLSENVDKKDFGYQLKLGTDIRFNRKTSATVYVNYVSREIRIDGYSFGYFDSSASFTRKFFDNNLMCTIGVSNILNNLTKHGDYTEYAGIIWNTLNSGSKYQPMIFASLQYKFRQGDRGTQNAGKMN